MKNYREEMILTIEDEIFESQQKLSGHKKREVVQRLHAAKTNLMEAWKILEKKESTEI